MKKRGGIKRKKGAAIKKTRAARIRVKAVLAISAVFAASAVAVIVINVQNGRSQDVPLRKIREEVANYDNWAVFLESGNSPVMDGRVAVYADKMLEEARREGAECDVVSRYDLGLVLADANEWFARNSWRFGFIEQTGEGGISGDYRYVGVFPAEQMYYSGLTLEEYRQIKN